MPAAERMTVAMPTGMAETLRQIVTTGRYVSTSETVRDRVGSRDAELRDLEALQAAITASLDRVPGIPADEVFAELHDRYAASS